MASAAQIGAMEQAPAERIAALIPQEFYTIPQLAERWHCSRASVYNVIRGEKVLDFAASGRKGHKLVPLETVQKIERARMRILR
jgi:hypothetical protein